MNAAAKFRIAAMVVVILLFNPLCICLGASKVAGPPEQSCHSSESAPHNEESEKPNCFYTDTQMAPIESAQLNAPSPHLVAEFNAVSIANQLSAKVMPAFPVAMFALDDRFVSLHQFRI